MEFTYGAFDGQASTSIPPSSSFSYFTEQAIRVGYSSPDFGRSHGFFREPTNVREAIQRELEKERIREDIIASEIARRRILEAEVRREMLLERELALRRGGEFSSPLSSSALRFEPRLPILPQSESRSIEERIVLSLEERLAYSAARREIGGFQTLPFQRSVAHRVAEVKPLPEVSEEAEKEKEKTKIILMAKPDVNVSGTKRKSVTPPAVSATELPSGSKKRIKEEWSCALCQVTATSEQGLNDHLQGKKHKAKEEGLRAQRTRKNFNIGLFPKKASKPSKLVDIVETPGSNDGEKIGGKLLQVNKTRDVSLQKGADTEKLTNNDGSLKQLNKDGDASKKKGGGIPKKKNGKSKLKMHKIRDNKKKFYLCEICLVVVFSEKSMNAHKKGKKHMARLQEVNQNGRAAPATPMVENTMINGAEQVPSEEKMTCQKMLRL